MQITRRQLIVLTGAAALGGCGANPGSPGDASSGRGSVDSVDAGPVEKLSRAGIDARFRDVYGFYLVRTPTRLYAQSAICTHRACKLDSTATGFLCRCHGSTFTADGAVTKGPATRDLPRFAIEVDRRGHVIVHPGRRIPPGQLDVPGAFVGVIDAG